MISYHILKQCVSVDHHLLSLNLFPLGGVLQTIEIVELFSYVLYVVADQDISDIHISGSPQVLASLETSNMRYHLMKILGLSAHTTPKDHLDHHRLLQEIIIFSNKNEFYALNEKILHMSHTLGLSEDTAYLVLSSLGEIIDNVFFHNLGRRKTSYGPLCIFLAQHDADTHKLSFVISDLGIGFSASLQDNYPDVDTESEYITIALKPGITGRYQHKGGNGLVYLQNNIFNGFKGELHIRSNGTFVQVINQDTILVLENDINMIGSCISFSLLYAS